MSNVQINSRKQIFTFFKKSAVKFKFLSIDAYYDIKFYCAI